MATLTVGGGPPVGGEAQTFQVTDVAQTVLDDATYAAMRATMGAGTSSVTLPIAESDVTNLTTDLAALDTRLDTLEGVPVIPTLAHGVYTPTRSAEANTDSNVTMSEAQYLRVGATVTVSGRFTIDPTAPATMTSFEMTLPVASNLGAAEDLAGVAFCGAIAGQGAAIFGVVANDTAKVSFVSADLTSQLWSFTFAYAVI